MALDMKKLGNIFAQRGRGLAGLFEEEKQPRIRTPFDGLFDNVNPDILYEDESPQSSHGGGLLSSLAEGDEPSGRGGYLSSAGGGSDEWWRNLIPDDTQNNNMGLSDTLTGAVEEESPLVGARRKYEEALAAPVQKQKWWKDFLVKGATIASNAVNPDRRLPVMGWGAATKNRDVQRSYRQYAPLQQQADADLIREGRQIQNENARLKPQFEQQKIDLQRRRAENQYLRDQQRYDQFLQSEENKDRRANNQTKLQEIDGYLFRVYPNDPTKPMEPVMDPRTGKQAFNPANVAQEITFDDGTKAYAKGGQIVAGKFSAQESAKRQEDQQAFQAGENEKNRQAAAERQRITIAAQKEARALEAAIKNGRQEDIQKHQRELSRLRSLYQKYGADNVNVNPEGVGAAAVVEP